LSRGRRLHDVAAVADTALIEGGLRL